MARVRQCLVILVALSACETAGGTATDSESGFVFNYPTNAICPKVVSFFGDWSGVAGGRRLKPHSGIDIPVPVGTPVRAVANGIVYAFVPNREPSGRRVGMNLYVQHRPSDFGPAKDRFKEVWTTRYMHVQKKNFPVNIGDEVKKGQVIAYSGSHPSRDHLHFAVRSVGMQGVNPLFIYAETFDGLEQNSKFANLSYTDGTNFYPSNAIIIWPIACKNIS